MLCLSKINIDRVGKNKYMYTSYFIKTQKIQFFTEK